MSRARERLKLGIMPARREPSGKPQRPTLERLKEIERERGEVEMATVLAQPHRRGERSHLAASALGRFVLQHKMAHAIYDAGEEYAAIVRRWHAAKGIPRLESDGVGGSGDGPTDGQVIRWRQRMDVVEAALSREGFRVYYAARRLILEGMELPPGSDDDAKRGLKAVAVALEFMQARDHPFLNGR